MTLSIRPLAAADFDKWFHLWRAYLAFYQNTLAGDIYDVTFSWLITPDHPDQNAFVAVSDGTRICASCRICLSIRPTVVPALAAR